MGKKAPNATSGPQMSVTIREASTGKKQNNVKSCLKLEHLKKLAVWSSGEAAIPPLAAFFGHHLAASSEALGTPVDPSLFTCQRCESVLQAGYNCTIRIEGNKTKTRHKRKKSAPYPQNNIVYTCHFCSHRNVKRGTPQGRHTGEIHPHPPKTKSATPGVHKGKTGNLGVHKGETGNLGATTTAAGMMDAMPSGLTKVNSDASTPLTLLEAKKRKRKRNRSAAKKPETIPADECVSRSNRRRRKSWTSLKEIAEANESDNSKRFADLTVPFSLQ